MSTKSSRNLKGLKKKFNALLIHESEEERNGHDAQMLMFDVLSEVQQVLDAKNMTRKMLAEKIKTSASYLTQLFRGDKPLNFVTLAKIQKALDIEFAISVKMKPGMFVAEDKRVRMKSI